VLDPASSTRAVSPLATFGQRALAMVIDLLLLVVVDLVLSAAFGTAAEGPTTSLLGLAYFTVMEGSHSGQTVGKRLLGIRVVDLRTGGPIGMGRAFGRHLARSLSFLVLFLGYLWMLRDAERQTWHDKLVGAVVVREAVYPVNRRPVGER
jgi:uncharacterized RDD family membrane protein YckC